MIKKDKVALRKNSPYRASLTREHFLFHEMRIVSSLLNKGLSDDQVVKKVYEDNLFQYPTEKSLKSIAKTCIKRIKAMDNKKLTEMIEISMTYESKHICLYAMMKQHRLMRDFMISVIGEKYRTRDYNFDDLDIITYLNSLEEQDDYVQSWSDTTLKKIKWIIKNTLVQTDYLENIRSKKLRKVLIDSDIKEEIINNGDKIALKAFGIR